MEAIGRPVIVETESRSRKAPHAAAGSKDADDDDDDGDDDHGGNAAAKATSPSALHRLVSNFWARVPTTLHGWHLRIAAKQRVASSALQDVDACEERTPVPVVTSTGKPKSE